MSLHGVVLTVSISVLAESASLSINYLTLRNGKMELKMLVKRFY